jgi:hypothetical protein
VDHKGWLPQLIPDKTGYTVLIAVERKLASMIPLVCNIPQHEVMVELVEAVVGIKQSRAKASFTLIAREANVLSRPGVDLRGQQSFSANVQHNCVVLRVFIVLHSADTILCPPGRLRIMAWMAWRLAFMPDQRPVQSWTLPHALVASTFVLAWKQSDHRCIHASLTLRGRMPGVLLSATVRTMFTARYTA